MSINLLSTVSRRLHTETLEIPRQADPPRPATLNLFFALAVCETHQFSAFPFQTTISNKHSCCNNSNNNCVKVCDNQLATVVPEKKESEVLMKEEEESYEKFRQLLAFDDVRSFLFSMKNEARNFIF